MVNAVEELEDDVCEPVGGVESERKGYEVG